MIFEKHDKLLLLLYIYMQLLIIYFNKIKIELYKKIMIIKKISLKKRWRI